MNHLLIIMLIILILKNSKRRYNLFSDNFIDRLLPTDRANYTGINGGKELQKSSFKLPSKSWIWKTEWTYEKTLSDVIYLLSYQ